MIQAVQQQENKVKEFPKIMIGGGGLIVLFIEPEKGIILRTGDIHPSHRDGKYCDDWNMEYFTDYNEPITIQNA